MTGHGPVFVVGCPRSGTSALSWALAEHPAYWTSVETHFFYYLLRGNRLEEAYSAGAGVGSWLDTHLVSQEEFMARVGSGFDRLMRSRSYGRHWVDGSPENLMVAVSLLRLFAEARMIHVVRNPRSVCLSMLASGFAEPWASDLGAAIDTWKHYAAAAIAVRDAFPDRVIQIRQEDMRAAPAETASAIGRFLCLDDVEPIAAFLGRETINSSFDKASYADQSPYREADVPRIDPDEFHLQHDARIWEETADLAAHYGYIWG